MSEKLRQLLDEHAGVPFEFLPLLLESPRGKALPDRYFLANPLGTLDCMDAKRSDFDMDAISKDRVHRFRRLELDPRRIPGEVKLFRLAHEPTVVLVREDLAKEIRRQGCAGMRFQALKNFGQEFR